MSWLLFQDKREAVRVMLPEINPRAIVLPTIILVQTLVCVAVLWPLARRPRSLSSRMLAGVERLGRNSRARAESPTDCGHPECPLVRCGRRKSAAPVTGIAASWYEQFPY
jgi:hypothetical protein